MFIVWVMCGVMDARVAVLCSSWSLQIILNGDEQLCMKLDDQWVLTVMKRPTSGNWTQYSTLVTVLFTVYAQTPAHLMWGLLRVCAACPTPHLKFKLRPSWNNIHDTFPTGTVQDTTLVPCTMMHRHVLGVNCTLQMRKTKEFFTSHKGWDIFSSPNCAIRCEPLPATIRRITAMPNTMLCPYYLNSKGINYIKHD